MNVSLQLTDWLPTTRRELEIRGWDEVDVVLFSGDAYVDHPSFGAAVIGRWLESMHLRVALVPQPDWRGDHRDFTKMGRPRLFFAVTGGNMDSMVNHYTANKRLRSEDAYTAEGKAGARPDYATVVYCHLLKQLFPDVPVLIGGIEASLRRLTHYDYWSDSLKPSILVDSGADLLIYGMGEMPLKTLVERLQADTPFHQLTDIPQTAYLRERTDGTHAGVLRLHSHEACLREKRHQAVNFRFIEEASNRWQADTLIQGVGHREVVVNPPFPPMETTLLDSVYELPYTRLPHPKYKGKTIPAYEMIKYSVNIHRGCFGGCAFCTISAHQGKFISSRSVTSVVNEVKKLAQLPGFSGYLSDLGGPSANMYAMAGKNLDLCKRCKRPSCIHPSVCSNLDTDHQPLIDLYRCVDALPGIKKSFIGSGIRYDLLVPTQAVTKEKAPQVNLTNNPTDEYLKEVIYNHVSGRLKVAPEHVSDDVLNLMRKPSFNRFRQFKERFDAVEEQRQRERGGGRQQLIPYFISSHPACKEEDMALLAIETKNLNFKLEQVQDFTPTPMTLATEIYYTGQNPYTLKPVYTAKSKEEKQAQRAYFFWYDRDGRDAIIRRLNRLKRPDLIQRLFGPSQHNSGKRSGRPKK